MARVGSARGVELGSRGVGVTAGAGTAIGRGGGRPGDRVQLTKSASYEPRLAAATAAALGLSGPSVDIERGEVGEFLAVSGFTSGRSNPLYDMEANGGHIGRDKPAVTVAPPTSGAGARSRSSDGHAAAAAAAAPGRDGASLEASSVRFINPLFGDGATASTPTAEASAAPDEEQGRLVAQSAQPPEASSVAAAPPPLRTVPSLGWRRPPRPPAAAVARSPARPASASGSACQAASSSAAEGAHGDGGGSGRRTHSARRLFGLLHMGSWSNSSTSTPGGRQEVEIAADEQPGSGDRGKWRRKSYDVGDGPSGSAVLLPAAAAERRRLIKANPLYLEQLDMPVLDEPPPPSNTGVLQPLSPNMASPRAAAMAASSTVLAAAEILNGGPVQWMMVPMGAAEAKLSPLTMMGDGNGGGNADTAAVAVKAVSVSTASANGAATAATAEGLCSASVAAAAAAQLPPKPPPAPQLRARNAQALEMTTTALYAGSVAVAAATIAAEPRRPTVDAGRQAEMPLPAAPAVAASPVNSRLPAIDAACQTLTPPLPLPQPIPEVTATVGGLSHHPDSNVTPLAALFEPYTAEAEAEEFDDGVGIAGFIMEQCTRCFRRSHHEAARHHARHGVAGHGTDINALFLANQAGIVTASDAARTASRLGNTGAVYQEFLLIWLAKARMHRDVVPPHQGGRFKLQADVSDFRAAFEALDGDRSGSVTTEELFTHLLLLAGTRATRAELRAMIAEINYDGDNKVDFSEFLVFMVFCFLDVDGNGCVEVHDIVRASRRVKMRLPGGDVLAMVDLADPDGDRKIGLRQFSRLFQDVGMPELGQRPTGHQGLHESQNGPWHLSRLAGGAPGGSSGGGAAANKHLANGDGESEAPSAAGRPVGRSNTSTTGAATTAGHGKGAAAAGLPAAAGPTATAASGGSASTLAHDTRMEVYRRLRVVIPQSPT